MKKILIAVVMLMGFGASGAVLAAAGPFNATNIAVTAGVGGDCSMLAEDVTLGVSKNVWGHYTCDEVANVIKVGACHTGGTRKAIPCSLVDDDADPLTPPVPNSSLCTQAQAAASENSDTPDYSAFTASSAGGSMAARDLGGRCANTTLTGLAFW